MSADHVLSGLARARFEAGNVGIGKVFNRPRSRRPAPEGRAAPEPFGRELPGEVLDARYQAWWLAPTGDGLGYWPSGGARGPRCPLSYRDLAATRGPLRPVVAVSTADIHTIDQLLAAAPGAGPVTIATAVGDVHRRLCADRGHLSPTSSSELAWRRLTAASVGTAPADALVELTERLGRTVGPSDCADLSTVLSEVILRWICHPSHYVDPVRAFASAVGNIGQPPGHNRLAVD